MGPAARHGRPKVTLNGATRLSSRSAGTAPSGTRIVAGLSTFMVSTQVSAYTTSYWNTKFTKGHERRETSARQVSCFSRGFASFVVRWMTRTCLTPPRFYSTTEVWKIVPMEHSPHLW